MKFPESLKLYPLGDSTGVCGYPLGGSCLGKVSKQPGLEMNPAGITIRYLQKIDLLNHPKPE
jgi:hypothetical protein